MGDWSKVVIAGFGKAAGIALYAATLQLLPKPVAGLILFSPVVMFPAFLGEKAASVRKSSEETIAVFTVWGGRNRSTPGTYRQLLSQTLRKTAGVKHTPDSQPEGDHVFDGRSVGTIQQFLPILLRNN